jgi:hypothetical protein
MNSGRVRSVGIAVSRSGREKERDFVLVDDDEITESFEADFPIGRPAKNSRTPYTARSNVACCPIGRDAAAAAVLVRARCVRPCLRYYAGHTGR